MPSNLESKSAHLAPPKEMPTPQEILDQMNGVIVPVKNAFEKLSGNSTIGTEKGREQATNNLNKIGEFTDNANKVLANYGLNNNLQSTNSSSPGLGRSSSMGSTSHQHSTTLPKSS